MKYLLKSNEQANLYFKNELIGSIYTAGELQIEIDTIYKGCIKVKYEVTSRTSFIIIYADRVDFIDAATNELKGTWI